MAKIRRMHWTGPPHEDEFELLPDDTALPYEIHDHPGLPAVLVPVVIGIALLLPALWFIVLGHAGDFVEVLVPALFALVGCFFLVAGAMAWRRSSLSLTEDGVSCDTVAGFRRVTWAEPLTAYRGILRRVVEGLSNDSSVAFYEILLYHEDDPAKSIKLYRARDDTGFLARQRRLARTFGLPALTETEDGLAEVAIEDLGKPLRQKAREGATRIPKPVGPVPADLLVAVAEDTLTVRVRRRLPLAALVAGLVCAGFGVFMLREAWDGQPASLLPFGLFDVLFGIIPLMVGAYVALLRLLVVQVLQVSRDRATTWHEFVNWPFGRRSIDADSVEEVTIGPPNAHPLARALPLPSQCGNMFCAAAVRITGQDDEIAFGESLSKESRAWVRDCVASVLTA